MAYADYDGYTALYPNDNIDSGTFSRLLYAASRRVENATTGVDGYSKLENAFPTSCRGAEAVRMCVCDLIHTLHEVEQAEMQAASATGYVTRADGTVVSKAVASVSAGNESIHYATGSSNAAATRYAQAAQDSAVLNAMIAQTIWNNLTMVADANGVNLLYMGRYPARQR